ncbi:MAG: RAMP superfamily CRISPR-associated protein [Ignisphaera sp.]
MDANIVGNRLREFIEREKKLNTVLYLKLVFKPLNSLGLVHIASERGAAYTPVFRVGDEIYIPASSFIGALRSAAESIAKASLNAFGDTADRIFAEAHCEPEEDIIRHICSPRGDEYLSLVKNLVKVLTSNRDLYRHFLTDDAATEISNIMGGVDSLDKIPRELEPVLSALCPICRLFGGPGLGSKISVLRVEPHIVSTHMVTHVSISRQSSTAMPQRLYTREYAALDSLSIDITIKNVVRGGPELRMLRAVLEYLNKVGISIGGAKSIGVGKLFLDLENSRGIYIDLNTINDKTKLLDALINIENLAQKPLGELLKEFA